MTPNQKCIIFCLSVMSAETTDPVHQDEEAETADHAYTDEEVKAGIELQRHLNDYETLIRLHNWLAESHITIT